MLAAVVLIVNTDVALLPEVIVMLPGFRLHVGRLFAPEGEAVKAHVRFIVPEYVLLVAKLTVAVVLLPGDTAGGVGAATTTCATVMVVLPLAAS